LLNAAVNPSAAATMLTQASFSFQGIELLQILERLSFGCKGEM